MFSGDAARVLAFARRAEERGFDGVFAFDHLFPPGASRTGSRWRRTRR
jgi:alkanesulfonate monooxygenase SsuD/methylene tetrahydromethanopterin reductase-like flavin-dependent oxidoreductase (luciferase family)